MNPLKHSTVIIDNPIFLMHYGVTTIFLVVFSLLAFCSYKNESVPCIPEDDISPKVLEAFSLVYSTCAQHNAFKIEDGKHNYTESKYHLKENIFNDDVGRLSLLFLFQAVIIFLPRYFWKSVESGRLERLLSFLHNTSYMPMDNIVRMVNDVLVNSERNKYYLTQYFTAEIFNVIASIFCIGILEFCLGGVHQSQSVDVIEFADKNFLPCWFLHCNSSPNILPKFDKCTIRRYISLENIKSHEAMLIMPTSIIYGKIYIFLWWWFLMMCMLSCLAVAYRTLIHVSPLLRFIVLDMSCENINTADLNIITRASGTGDWFLIHLLSKNMDPNTFTVMMMVLAGKLQNDLIVPES
ncbi:innexin shaking-B [Caerostris darwini]|uniref:Innexin n=1 Tax=Caerostris darwini TaxID=1538125 RepID=A0AAV4PSB3_9ARAC|nr:innexin shaking-B [Caerostris darwini]